MKVTADSFVKMHFKFRLKDGSIAEDTENYNRAFIFKMGQGCFTEKVEKELLGAQVGTSKRIVLMPEEAFGEKHPASIYSVPKTRFPKSIELEEGLIVSFSQKDGTKLPGLITEISEDDVTVDFNHPLSGQIIVFEAKILGVAENEEDLNEDTVS
ncbi:FKBP-type peptidyl-prolyl cis-trans isomerase [Allofrancisella guangzhouensis]|uniref:Peptidyl-prolyl cis-trans isomerase n=1 Tax=Allofrancisella guangzhouensis TaxID=594679 RepID=A0A0A8E2I8_9GAMM|nr:FKBP-type peptidyl-prolyl cis-trans isomerase [Allofrancisella guangzhouensis]AJC48198.1 peptidylprolyl isomerase [Allofrancisella guangzhouensis]MBK2027065.1 FKBP-type peptidyl-prolyl cis-trans isomerase [Allofrancisella guangzhouensis]MBK2044555.1 FKBP-type peptidyl-prolyl cis-trans isomerase [Allofrancisella guangzhouensis]MBK2046113.1 FKBP-type peptidyl-prolyl cis-trans isomerase [Allofrancisella guangzhouensis]